MILYYKISRVGGPGLYNNTKINTVENITFVLVFFLHKTFVKWFNLQKRKKEWKRTSVVFIRDQ